MITFSKIILLFFIITLQILSNTKNPIIGIWELVYVAPTEMEDTEPRGISNIRLYFTPDGKLFSLMPDQSLNDSIPYVKYEMSEDTLSIITSKEDPVVVNVNFTDSSTMIFNPAMTGRRIFKRIYDNDNLNTSIELKSLQLVYTGDLAPAELLEYDETDYSMLPIHEKIIGVWETIKYADIPHGDMPPYGFPNDIWIIEKEGLEVIHRASGDTIHVSYQLTSNNELVLNAPDRSVTSWKVIFNKWGHLILDSGDGLMEFKLVTKNTDKVPAVPIKIVLLKLKGEE